MNCLKCGKDTTAGQVFCDSCLDSMDSYPVKPGTAVTLPAKRPSADTKKSAYRKRSMTPDEQITLLQKQLRRSRIFGLILAFLLLAVSAVLLYEVLNPETSIIGQNYIIDTTLGTD